MSEKKTPGEPREQNLDEVQIFKLTPEQRAKLDAAQEARKAEGNVAAEAALKSRREAAEKMRPLTDALKAFSTAKDIQALAAAAVKLEPFFGQLDPSHWIAMEAKNKAILNQEHEGIFSTDELNAMSALSEGIRKARDERTQVIGRKPKGEKPEPPPEPPKPQKPKTVWQNLGDLFRRK